MDEIEANLQYVYDYLSLGYDKYIDYMEGYYLADYYEISKIPLHNIKKIQNICRKHADEIKLLIEKNQNTRIKKMIIKNNNLSKEIILESTDGLKYLEILDLIKTNYQEYGYNYVNSFRFKMYKDEIPCFEIWMD